MESNFLEQFDSVKGLILATGPRGFFGLLKGSDITLTNRVYNSTCFKSSIKTVRIPFENSVVRVFD